MGMAARNRKLVSVKRFYPRITPQSTCWPFLATILYSHMKKTPGIYPRVFLRMIASDS